MLNQSDIEYITKCLKEGKEIPKEYENLLFPTTHKECELVYADKMRKEDILANEDGSFPVPLQVEKVFDENEHKPFDDGWRNMLVFGDNLQFLKTIYENKDPIIKDKVKGQVKLIYIDPPFATTEEFQNKDGAKAYSDKKKGAEFVEFLRRRLILAKEILADDGSIYVHLDQKMCHYIKILMDEIFEKNNFRNEIAWCYTGPSQAINYFPRKHDTILFYSNGKNYFESPRIDHKSGVHNSGQLFGNIEENKKIKLELESMGKKVEDWWTDIWSCDRYRSELINYPTQKPEALLKRIIEASTREGDIILDFFGGSGTTAATAEKLNRKWISCDIGKLSYFIIQKRILQIQNSKDLFNSKKKYNKMCKSFVSCKLGSYDLKQALELKWDKYKQFVSELFAIEINTFKVAGIEFDGKKDDYPVKIFDYNKFKESKIDENYLENIHGYIGDRISSSRVYIVAPANKFDFIQDYWEIDDIRYYFLKIPYQMIKELHSKPFQKFRQPKSKKNINSLDEAIGFSFNRNPEVISDVKKINDEVVIEIVDFKCNEPSTDKSSEEKNLNNFEFLSSIFLDKNYNGKEFVMTDYFFYDDIEKTNNSLKLSFNKYQIGKQIMLVYTDIYGNDFTEIIMI